MISVYGLLNEFLDPVVLVLTIMAVGLVISFRRKKGVFGKILLMVSFLFLYFASISPISEAACYLLEKDYLHKISTSARQFDIIVVLGGGISENTYSNETWPSNQTASRLLYGIQVFRQTGAQYLVFCGKGVGRLSEAEVMQNAAGRSGIPIERIITDIKSRNTREHADELNLIFSDKKLRMGLVTSGYHMKRAEREIRKYFLNVEPLPSDYLFSTRSLSLFSFLPHLSRLNKFALAFREIIGNVWYRIKD